MHILLTFIQELYCCLLLKNINTIDIVINIHIVDIDESRERETEINIVQVSST